MFISSRYLPWNLQIELFFSRIPVNIWASIKYISENKSILSYLLRRQAPQRTLAWHSFLKKSHLGLVVKWKLVVSEFSIMNIQKGTGTSCRKIVLNVFTSYLHSHQTSIFVILTTPSVINKVVYINKYIYLADCSSESWTFICAILSKYSRSLACMCSRCCFKPANSSRTRARSSWKFAFNWFRSSTRIRLRASSAYVSK